MLGDNCRFNTLSIQEYQGCVSLIATLLLDCVHGTCASNLVTTSSQGCNKVVAAMQGRLAIY